MQSIESNFTVPPFPAFPSVSRYVPLGSIQDAFARICRSIDAREGVSLVIGPPGTGKSLMCGLLVNHYRDSRDVVVLGETPIKDSAAFQRHLLHHLGADFDAIKDGDLQLALIDRICDAEAPSGGLLIVVDEAQSLSEEVLESIRMATNIMREGEPRVYAVLCGGVKLEESLVSSAMEAFTQRVATRCYLHAMNGDETRNYITETIRACGADPENTITSEAIAAVHHACLGVPRLINQIMTEAIDCAEEMGQELINEQVIDKAWAQLQQLPSPMVDEPKFTIESSPIEFGELGESESDRHEVASEEVLADLPEGSCQSLDFEPCDYQESTAELCEIVTEPIEFAAEETFEFAAEEPYAEVEDVCAESQESGQDICIDSAAAQCELESIAVDEVAMSEQAQICEVPGSPVSPVALFGDFDDEEEVAIGNGVAAAVQQTTSQPATDLESMLHQEIIGISAVAVSGLEPVDPCEVDCDQLEDSDVEIVREQQEVVKDFITKPIDPEADPVDADDSVVWTSEESDEVSARDDIDLLVIEDEIELTIDNVKTVDAREQTVSVDFQAMLARMRSGA